MKKALLFISNEAVPRFKMVKNNYWVGRREKEKEKREPSFTGSLLIQVPFDEVHMKLMACNEAGFQDTLQGCMSMSSSSSVACRFLFNWFTEIKKKKDSSTASKTSEA